MSAGHLDLSRKTSGFSEGVMIQRALLLRYIFPSKYGVPEEGRMLQLAMGQKKSNPERAHDTKLKRSETVLNMALNLRL